MDGLASNADPAFGAGDVDDRNILQKYGWHIIFTLLTLYHFRDNVISPFGLFLNKHRRLGTSSESSSSQSQSQSNQGSSSFGINKGLSHKERMMKARQAQQEKAQRESDAKKEQNKLKKQERLKQLANAEKKKSKKTIKKDNPYKKDSFNPLAPSSGGSCSYRPGRKGPSRGG